MADASVATAFPGYLTPVDLIRLKLVIDGQLNTSAHIKDLIISDIRSQAKQDIQAGENYYRGENDIRNRVIKYWNGSAQVQDLTKANNKVIHPFHKLLVDQKVSYILGNPIKFTTDEKKFQDSLNKELGDWWNDIIHQWVLTASNAGVSFLHIYMDENGEFDYAVIPSQQCIPVYDSAFQKEIMYMIRYYVMEIQDQDTGIFVQRYKVEWWDKEKVEYFIEDANGFFIPDDTVYPNPRFHWTSFSTATPENVEGNSWGRVPFIELQNNDFRRGDLYAIKSLIDIYDLAISDWANNLEDIQEAVWALTNYGGADASKFLSDLKTYKVILLDNDGAATPQKIEIPYKAREDFLKVVQDNIYHLGQGVNLNIDSTGRTSGVALKYHYIALDLKSQNLVRKMKYALKDFVWFLTSFINLRDKTKYDPESVRFTFDFAILVNELEKIQEVQSSLGIVSKETLLKNHPFVENVEEELKLIEKENQGQIDLGQETTIKPPKQLPVLA